MDARGVVVYDDGRGQRRMNIAFVSPYDHAVPGGVSVHINKLAGQFREWGHHVRVIGPCSAPQSIEDEDFIPMGRPVPVPSGGSIARVSFSVWLRPRIKEMLQQEKFDVVHLHEPFSGFLPLEVLSQTASMGIPNVGTFHSFQGTWLYRVGVKRVVRRHFRKLQGRIAVSLPAYQYISGHFPADYRIIPNGIDVDEFADADPFPHLRDGMINLLFVGRLEKRKGLKYLLGAFSRLKWDWPNLRLLVVGAGTPDEDSYRIMGERNLKDVEFLGRVSDEDKSRYFKSADIFCSPATGRESFGIVLLEAMAAGKPVVATNIDGYASVITDGEEGLLVPPKKDEALADAIATLLGDPGLRASLAERGQKKANEYRWEIVAAKVMDYYETLLESRQPAMVPVVDVRPVPNEAR